MLCLTELSDSISPERRTWYMGLVVLHDVDSFTLCLVNFAGPDLLDASWFHCI